MGITAIPEDLLPFLRLANAWEKDSKGGTGDGAIAMRCCARMLTELLWQQARDRQAES